MCHNGTTGSTYHLKWMKRRPAFSSTQEHDLFGINIAYQRCAGLGFPHGVNQLG
jgi:hypothetical protein